VVDVSSKHPTTHENAPIDPVRHAVPIAVAVLLPSGSICGGSAWSCCCGLGRCVWERGMHGCGVRHCDPSSFFSPASGAQLDPVQLERWALENSGLLRVRQPLPAAQSGDNFIRCASASAVALVGALHGGALSLALDTTRAT
jgi:hypothetical protein